MAVASSSSSATSTITEYVKTSSTLLPARSIAYISTSKSPNSSSVSSSSIGTVPSTRLTV